MNKNKRVIFLFTVLVILSSSINSQNSMHKVRIDLEKSEIVVRGNTNITSYSLSEDGTDFLEPSYNVLSKRVGSKWTITPNKLTIPVNKFSSMNPIVLKEFREMLQADKYKNIEVEFTEIQNLNTIQAKENNIDVKMNLVMAGKERLCKLVFKVRKKGKQYVAKNELKINLREYGLLKGKRPLGVVKIDEVVTIYLSLVLFEPIEIKKD